jgi:hypothetical protein
MVLYNIWILLVTRKDLILKADATETEMHTTASVISMVDGAMENLSQVRSEILREKTGIFPLFVLVGAVLLNLWGCLEQAEVYMIVWISASLYFYLFYPMLPMFLFPLRYLTQKETKPEQEKPKESPLKWIVRINILRNLNTGFRLFMRFFILSLLPLTLGMIGIYFLSGIFSLILGGLGLIPVNTTALILVQCAGIILFYIEIFFFRDQLVHFVGYIRKQGSAEKKRVLLLGALCLIFLIVGTVVVVLLLIAILLPGFTLVSFINVHLFVEERSNIWIFVILVTQIIIMQFLQSLWSRRITRRMCEDLIGRLNDARNLLTTGTHLTAKENRYDKLQTESRQMHHATKILKETQLYAFNRRLLFGLFPTYSVGINLPALFSIKSLRELREIFSDDE